MASIQVIDDSDIPWRAIRGLALRVVRYAPLGERREGTDLIGRAHVKAASTRAPYAVLDVECVDKKPEVWTTESAIFRVFHREDFRAVDHAMTLVTDDLDVMVGHRPIRFPWYVPFKRAQPTMEVMVIPKDQARRDGENSRDYLVRTAALWSYQPLYERFQGRWDYLE